MTARRALAVAIALVASIAVGCVIGPKPDDPLTSGDGTATADSGPFDNTLGDDSGADAAPTAASDTGVPSESGTTQSPSDADAEGASDAPADGEDAPDAPDAEDAADAAVGG
jgi:hypothetical protein